MRHCRPDASAGLDDTRELSSSNRVVVEMLEDRDGASCIEAPVGERQFLGRTHDELGSPVDALDLREACSRDHSGDRQVAADRRYAEARSLDDSRRHAAHAHVEVGLGSLADPECLKNPVVEALPPLVDTVRAESRELTVEVRALVLVLCGQSLDKYRDALDPRILPATGGANQLVGSQVERGRARYATEFHAFNLDALPAMNPVFNRMRSSK